MNFIFWSALLFIVICIPPSVIFLVLLYYQRKINLTYSTAGFLRYKDITFYIDTNMFFMCITLKEFRIYFIWLRIRIYFSQLRVNFNLKTKRTSNIKINPMSKYAFKESFGKKKKLILVITPNKVAIDEEEDEEGDKKEKVAELNLYLKQIKEKFASVINEKYISKHNKKDKTREHEEDVVDNILKKYDLSRKDKIIRNLMVFFDFLIEDVVVNFKLSDLECYHSCAFRKMIVGAIKGLNKHKEIHFICIFYDLEVKEYLLKGGQGTEFSLMKNRKLFLNLKLEYGLSPVSYLSLLNTLNVKAELNKMQIEVSTRAINQIFKLVNQIVKYVSYMNKKKKFEEQIGRERKDSNEDDPFLELFTQTPDIVCVEETIINKVSSAMKKIKIKLNEVNFRIVSDNHNYIYTDLFLASVSYHMKNVFNYHFDSHKIKLLKSSTEVKLQDLQLTSNHKSKLILDLQTYSVNITEDVVYYYLSKEANIKSSVVSESPGGDIVMTTKELDKIIELIICIVVGLEKLEAVSERNSTEMRYVENYSAQSNLSLNFENFNLTVHDDVIQAEMLQLGVSVRIEEQKFIGNKVDVTFSPISLNVFRKFSTKYASNLLVKGFKLAIVDDFKSSSIEVVFEDTKLLFYDDHLIDALKFIADFLTYNLRNGVKRDYKKQLQKLPEKTKQENCKLTFKKINVYYYIDFDDLLTIKLSDFNFVIDKWLIFPLVKIYHQSTTKQFFKRKVQFITCKRFYIKFEPEINEMLIEFGSVDVNFYCFELVYCITKIAMYHHFFPLWIIYHMSYKHRVDSDYKLKYIAEFAKKERLKLKFEQITIRVNQNEIGPCAVLQTSPPLLSASSMDPVDYLRSIKCDQISLLITNFVMQTCGYYEKETTHSDLNSKINFIGDLSSGESYYRKITKKGQMEMTFEKIDVMQERSKLIELQNFKIDLQDEFIRDCFDLKKLNSIAVTYKMHDIFYKEINSRKTKNGQVDIIIENLKINLEDIKIIDKISLFSKEMVKTVMAFNFGEYAITTINDQTKCEEVNKLNVYVKNLNTVVNSIDPVSNMIYNRLYFKLETLVLSKDESKSVSNMQLSLFGFSFGFEFSQNFDYPLIIIPLCELNIDGIQNVIRINVPNNMFKKVDTNKEPKCVSLIDRFIMDTKGLTLFLNFMYLNTFHQMFENFWRRSAFVKRYLFDKKEIKHQSVSRLSHTGLQTIEVAAQQTKSVKILLSVFDFKIVYLLKYKNDYSTTFRFHEDIRDKGYFGYILRFYSISIKYLANTSMFDELKINMNLFTVTSLHDENLNDEIFFKFDKEIKLSRFNNLKHQNRFNDFMETPGRRFKLLNDNLLPFFELLEDEELDNSNYFTMSTLIISKPDTYSDLIFDYKHTLIKIFHINFKREKRCLNEINKSEDIYITVNEIKVSWNKFNMDVMGILLFNDVLLIIDKILLKINKGKAVDDSKEIKTVSALDLGRFNFVFELNEPQICIQNELKKSTVLLTTKTKCTAKINKICVNENSKDFHMDIQINEMALYIAPNYMESNHIYWIGDNEENIYYLEEKLFNRMLFTPTIHFYISENIQNNPITGVPDLHSNINIDVDKLIADFGNKYFNHFTNIIEVFIFDRGYSYAEEKGNLDSRAKDIELFKSEEIKSRIETNMQVEHNRTKQKEISFSMKDIVLTLQKEGKELIKLMMKNFEGEHMVFADKASETRINVKNLKILDLFKNKNDTILSPNFKVSNSSGLEDKIDLLTFRRKDSYVSIGTDSKWYILDYLELGVLPLYINMSKEHCEFILEFFFNESISTQNEDEFRNILMTSNKKTALKKMTPPSSDIKEKMSNSTTISPPTNETEYPVYFNHVRINETYLKINFFISDNSFNLKNAKVKFSSFEKKEKFYTNKILLHRLIHHLKMISINNFPNLLSSIFFWGENEPNKLPKKKDDEEIHRRMLLGKQSNK